jgi:hypothetical protein
LSSYSLVLIVINTYPKGNNPGVNNVEGKVKKFREKAKSLAVSLLAGILGYPGRELNPHGRNGHRILSPACLPIPPPGRGFSVKIKKSPE